MTKGDMAPENAQNEGITHGKKTGAFAFVGMDREVPSFMHNYAALPRYHTYITITTRNAR